MCQTLNMECDPIYMDENYEYSVNEELNVDISEMYGPFEGLGEFGFEEPSEDLEESSEDLEELSEDLEELSKNLEENIEESINIIETVMKCWSELIGYSCCPT